MPNNIFPTILIRFNTDKVWAEPVRFKAGIYTSKGDPAYIFLFSYVPASMKARMPYGPGHGTDISYAFGNLRAPNGATVAPEDKEVARMYLNATLLISKKNFPLSVSALVNKPLNSDIPSEYDLLWNAGLIYTFNKNYSEVRLFIRDL